MRVGCRLRWLGTGRTTWSDVRAVVHSAGPDSAIARAIRGHDWTQHTYFLADLIDLLAQANWQRQGKRNATRPKPVERPGSKEVQRIGKDPIPISEFDAWWDSH